MLVGTWALRKRRRSKLGDFADELSSDNLVRSGSAFGSGGSSSLGHGSVDVEKGATGAGGWGVDVIEKMEAVGGARGEGSMVGVGAGMTRGPSQAQRNATPAPASYGQRNNMPHQIAYGQSPYPQLPNRTPSRVDRSAPNAMFQQQPMYSQQYQPPTTYAAPYPPAQPQHFQAGDASPTDLPYGSYLPNPFDGVEPQIQYAPPHVDQFTNGPRHVHPVQRKPPPPFLMVDTNVSPAAPGPFSAGSLGGAPMQPASSVNRANPSMPPAESPQELTVPQQNSTSPRRSSLLDGPTTPKTPTSGKRHIRKASADRRAAEVAAALHPGPPPVAPPLPEEFGSGAATAAVSLPDSPRVLKVVNA